MKLRHYDHDGRVRFITFCTHQRMPLIVEDKFMELIFDCLDEIRRKYGFKLLAYVIMPDHVHLVIHPPLGLKVGEVIGEFKRISARKIHKVICAGHCKLLEQLTVTKNGRKQFVFWQRRCYDHNCRTEEAVWEKVNYCHNNPVKRGLAKNPEEWKWSSFRWYQEGGEGLQEIDFSELL